MVPMRAAFKATQSQPVNSFKLGEQCELAVFLCSPASLLCIAFSNLLQCSACYFTDTRELICHELQHWQVG